MQQPRISLFTSNVFTSSGVSNPVDPQAQAASIQHLLSSNDGSVALHLNGAGKGQPQSFTRVRVLDSFL
jgi:hypothetical protein